MCVIMCAHKEKRIVPEWVSGAYDANPSGAGIAWRDRDNKNRPVVRWAKGLDLAQIQEFCKDLPLPYCAHFRIPTCGGAIPRLTHPFPVEPRVDLALEGMIDGYVMFHNGHWGSWRNSMIETAARKGIKIPGDKWSDSRGMAWMAAHLGIGVLDLIDEKCVAFGPRDTEIYGTGWTMKDAVWCSNMGWEGRSHSLRPGYRWSQQERTYVKDDKEDTQGSPKTGIIVTDPKELPGFVAAPVDPTKGHLAYCGCPPCMEKRRLERKAVESAFNVASSEVDVPETPFLLAKRLLLEGEDLWKRSKKGQARLISKNEIKRRRREFERQERLLLQHRIQLSMLELSQNNGQRMH